MAGWVVLHRCIRDSIIYTMPPLYLRLFERMIMEANHEDREIPYEDGVRLIKRGQRLTSIRQIAQWVMWYEQGKERVPNPRTIMKILEWLEKNSMILIEGKKHRDGNRSETLYTVVNYGKYQSIGVDEVTANTTPRTTPSKQQVQPNNNDKQLRTIKREIYPLVLLSADEEKKLVEKLGQALYEDMAERLSLYKESTGKKYASDYATILTWHRKDGGKKTAKEMPSITVPL